MFHGKAFHVHQLCDAPDEPEANKTKLPFPPSHASDARAQRRTRAPAFALAVQCASVAGICPKVRAVFAG
jgi:hypothetical protein